MRDSLAGTQLGRYRIATELGRGGFGAVYRATDPDLQRQVALKVLSAHLAQDDAFLQRFLREARAVAGVHHTNVVTIYEVGQTEGVHYIAMEYVEGRNCSHW